MGVGSVRLHGSAKKRTLACSDKQWSVVLDRDFSVRSRLGSIDSILNLSRLLLYERPRGGFQCDDGESTSGEIDMVGDALICCDKELVASPLSLFNQ